MKAGQLRTVLLNVSDLEPSRRFYGELLGMRVQFAPEDDHVVVFDAGTTSLVLHGHGEYAEAGAPGPDQAGAVLLFFAVDDVDAAVAELRAAGVTVTQEPVDQSWGERDAAVLDPDGYSIHLTRSLEP